MFSVRTQCFIHMQVRFNSLQLYVIQILRAKVMLVPTRADLSRAPPCPVQAWAGQLDYQNQSLRREIPAP